MTTKNIHEANLAEVKKISENAAEFIVRPLYYGYGNTLGNSFRRVLLSSVKGAAITAFSIEGSTHDIHMGGKTGGGMRLGILFMIPI